MKNPINIFELLCAGFTWRSSVTAARPLTVVFWRRLFLVVAVAGWSIWALAAWSAIAMAHEEAEVMTAWRDVERKRGDFYESQFINCLNWKTAQIQGVVFDCPMKEVKR